jgi:hypothetical protein
MKISYDAEVDALSITISWSDVGVGVKSTLGSLGLVRQNVGSEEGSLCLDQP